MTLYFAYGANLDRDAMQDRCPAARDVGVASLSGHRFIIMAAGYATIVPVRTGVVHGLLWDLTAADIATLDAFEEVESGLYRHAILPIRQGRFRKEAMVYVAAEARPGTPQPGYLEAVIVAAERAPLPPLYCDELHAWLPTAELPRP